MTKKTKLVKPHPEHYLVILSEFGGDEYVSLIKDPALITWLDEPVEFNGSDQIRIDIPGVDNQTANVTSGSTWNDKLIAITNGQLPKTMVDTNPHYSTQDNFEQFAPEHIIEAQVY